MTPSVGFGPLQSSEDPVPGDHAASFRDALQDLAGQIGDADRQHSDALRDMQSRLTRLSGQADEARAGLSDPQADLLRRIDGAVRHLAKRIAQRPAAFHSDGPWDAQSAEALTRLYETGECDLAKSARRSNTIAGPKRPDRTPRQSAKPQRAYPGRRQIEERLADIATRLQQTLAAQHPERSLAGLTQRFNDFEARFEAALRDVARRSDVEGLKLVEAQLRELTLQVERTQNQLTQLGAVELQLRELAQALEERQRPEAATQSSLSDGAIAVLVDTAAERAATRLAASIPSGTAAPDGQAQMRIDALEGLLKDHITERRRAEEHTASVLHAIEDALVRIVDRVDAIELTRLTQPSPVPDAQQPAPEAGSHVERDALAQAYAEGARALAPGLTLHAADFPTPQWPDQIESTADVGYAHQLDVESDEEQTFRDFRTSSTQFEDGREVMDVESDGEDMDAPDETGVRAARIRRSGLLFTAALVLLLGAGYYTTHVLMDRIPASLEVPDDTTNVQPSNGGVIESGAQNGASPIKTGTVEPRHDPPGEASSSELLPQDGLSASERRDQIEASSPQDAARVRAIGGALAAALGGTRISQTPRGEVILEDEVADSHPPAQPSFEEGAAAAEFEVATRLVEGAGVPRDLKQAFQLYHRAANRGLARAQYQVAALYERGMGVPADPHQAKVWYGRAAAQGHVKAMHNLAVLLAAGAAEGPDYAEAAYWFGKAAEAGLIDSQFNLAVLHLKGLGVPRDRLEAYKWLSLAARSGDKDAAQSAQQIKLQLAPAELKSAEETVAAWRAQAPDPRINGAALLESRRAVGQTEGG